MSIRRVTKSPGGETSHNIFSWSDGSEEKLGSPFSQPVGQVRGGQLIFGGDDSELEPTRRRPGHDSKLREMNGSGIFYSGPNEMSANAFANNDDQNNGNFITERPSVRLHQPAGGKSQISFGEDEPPLAYKKLLSPYKQIELSGTTETLADVQSRKNFSDSKMKELSGSMWIFAPPPEPVPVPIVPVEEPKEEDEVLARPSVRISRSAGDRSQIVFGESPPEPPKRRVSDRMVQDLMGRGASEEQQPSRFVNEAKKKELQGCDIFRDQKPVLRDYIGGVRKPPGGGSTIALI